MGFSFNKISLGAKNIWAEMAGRDSSLRQTFTSSGLASFGMTVYYFEGWGGKQGRFEKDLTEVEEFLRNAPASLPPIIKNALSFRASARNLFLANQQQSIGSYSAIKQSDIKCCH